MTTEPNNSVETPTGRTEHTPGPWILDDAPHGDLISDSYHFIDAGPGYADDKTGQGFGIAGCLFPADARLIAAAPELLDVGGYLLKAVLAIPAAKAAILEQFPGAIGDMQNAIARARNGGGAS